MTATVERDRIYQTDTAPKKSFVLLLAGIVAMTVGFGSIAGGVFGA